MRVETHISKTTANPASLVRQTHEALTSAKQRLEILKRVHEQDSEAQREREYQIWEAKDQEALNQIDQALSALGTAVRMANGENPLFPEHV